MRIPSYDDLTPPIPDAERTDTVLPLGLFVDDPAPARPAPRGTAIVSAPSALFACIEGVEGKQRVDEFLAVAREFSPRVAVAGARTVVVDVSGLGRLIGPPPVIAAEIDRAARGAGRDGLVACAPAQPAARLLAIGSAPRMVVTGNVATAIAALPVTLAGELETLPAAISSRDRARPFETLSRWGIATLGELAALP